MHRKFALVLLAFVFVAGALFFIVQSQALSYQTGQTLERGRTTLRLAASALEGRLNRFRALPALIAREALVDELLGDPHNAKLQDQANIYLRRVNALLQSSVIYLMAPDGMTVAASNYAEPLSFVGQNFNFRPYFQEALRGENGHFFALGTTSGKRGYYFSAPIILAGKVAGVVVFKVNLDEMEASWGRNAELEIIVVDPEDIIFLSSHRDWLYGSFDPIDASEIAATRQSRRYADTPLKLLPAHDLAQRDGYDLIDIAVDGTAHEYAALTQPMQLAGWSVKVLVDTRIAHQQALMDAIVALMVLGLLVLGGAMGLRERSRLAHGIKVHRDAQAKLETAVRHRTSDLARANARLEEEVGERREAEQQLRKTQSDLVQAGKLAALGQMSAALSHEFNQPLAALAVYADTAATYLDRNRPAEARDNISRMARLVDRLSTISRHLRSFARRPEEKLRPVDVTEVVDDVIELLARRIEAADATIVIAIAPEAAKVIAGTIRLQQVLLNLVSNALDAVEGLDDRVITVSAQMQGAKRVVIAVRDRGPGVPAAICERIFDPFFTTKGPGKGLGLGLSISYNIVKDFGGILAVGRHEEGGAVFTIELDKARVGAPVDA